MIGSRPSLGSGFRGLQQYLLHGRNGASPERSVWTSTRNLPGEPEQSAGIMRATANESHRVEKPVYHLSVSMAPGEELGREELERVADRLLEDLGLEGHQVLLAEHADGVQQHIHLMVNRVHPETGRAWSAWRDYERIEGSLRGQERELGLRLVPGRHAPVPGLERSIGTRLGVGGFTEEARELAGDAFRTAKSWQELHASLSGRGLTLQPSRSGRGLVVTDGRRYAAASKVAREASRWKLEAKLGPYQGPSRDLGRIREIARALDHRGKLEAKRTRWQSSLRDLGEKLADHKRAAEGLARASGDLDRVLGGVYRDPAAARQKIERVLEHHGKSTTLESLRAPGQYGKLLGRPASRTRRQARQAIRERLPEAIGNYAQAMRVERAKLERLTPYRRNPKSPIREAAGRAQRVLRRALGRLEKIDRGIEPRKQLERQAASIVKRLGWAAVQRLVPGPSYQMLRVAVSLANAPARLIGHGMTRGLDR